MYIESLPLNLGWTVVNVFPFVDVGSMITYSSMCTQRLGTLLEISIPIQASVEAIVEPLEYYIVSTVLTKTCSAGSVEGGFKF